MQKWILSALALTCAATAQAGPNAGGTLFLHANPSIAYTPDQSSYCGQGVGSGQGGLVDCAEAVNFVTGADPTLFYVVAAFDSGANPRVAGLTFGVSYTASISLVAQGSCADFELTTGGWPNSGEGTAITWNTARTSQLVEAYWFAGYNYYAPDPALFALTAHPTQGGQFADDSVPANLDAIAGFGTLGFDAPGSTPCPTSGPVEGACCFSDGSCAVLLADLCAANGGAFQGEGSVCDPNPCPQPQGACCSPETGCSVVAPSECTDHGAEYLGDGTTCDPYPCDPAGACCVPGEGCEISFEDHCVNKEGGTYVGDGTSCDPNPCGPVATESRSWGGIKATYR
ncbi:MAG: hypothetical protein IT349_16420 [Candidatus Eisenbacteria bacterium]|nr:hypothetical protein [Candidatus Eisenbacteria bacterium]